MHGGQVPAQLGDAVGDDSILARHSNPPLTSVSQPVEKIGSTIARLLLEEIDDPRTPRRHVVLPTRLVVRESSGGPSAD
ncbi:substrate-binding domain-containing protein [Streptomyces sp. NPDC001260]|uniref:substrate-binding domain-containing protein n=1 Tax=Streptomyces sp. NPDC001260 TaxID=3364551 RepID=UPI003678BF94